MSQVGRTVKNLEAPRPLKSSSRQSHHTQVYAVQSIEELITLTENVAVSLASGHSNPDNMTILTSNLRIHGPQLEMISKDTLDRTFVTFRNASQDERLSIITRMNLLELIELRAKSWQNSDVINTYYKHKATDVQPDNNLAMNDLSMLSTSPPAMLGQTLILGPGELIRPSGKFAKPTKIPGKNYSKDEVVIRNADSGKVNPGAKERLVQITGPNEEKINYAKQLIEDTIRRNASPVRLEAPQDGSCSSLASSTSDDAIPRANRNSVGAMIASGSVGSMHVNNYVPNQHTIFNNNNSNNINNNNNNNSNNSNIGVGLIGGSGNIKLPRNSGGQLLLHSLSTNDASLGEYKYTVGVGQHNIKITGDCFELVREQSLLRKVRVAKLVLDDYFSSNEFLASVEAGAAFDASTHMNTSIGSLGSVSSANTIHPASHQLISASPFVDSGIGLNMMGSSSSGTINNNSIDVDDDVFIVENVNKAMSTDSSNSTSSSNSTVTMASTPVPTNGLTRSRRSHFSRKESTPEGNREQLNASARIVHEYERLIFYAKSPHSWVLPRDWAKIIEKNPSIVRNKDLDDEKNRFDADKYLILVKSGSYAKIAAATDDESPDPE